MTTSCLLQPHVGSCGVLDMYLGEQEEIQSKDFLGTGVVATISVSFSFNSTLAFLLLLLLACSQTVVLSFACTLESLGKFFKSGATPG